MSAQDSPQSAFSDEDYVVGYGKPPEAGKFKKGRSGNPRGRPKGSRNFATYLEEMLEATLSLSENGRTRKVTTVEAGLAKLRAKALSGDTRALEKLLDYAERYALEQANKDEAKKLSTEDRAIFDAYEARIREEAAQNIAAQPTREIIDTNEQAGSSGNDVEVTPSLKSSSPSAPLS